MAEGVGFEPTVGIHPQRFSRPSHSAALAPFRLATLSVGMMGGSRNENAVWRRGWDSNPRKLALHALSKRADSAALAPLRIVVACGCNARTTAGYRRTHSRIADARCQNAATSIGTSVWNNVASSSEVAVGSCATDTRESGQVRKEAAFIGSARVPQIAWPSLQSAKFPSASFQSEVF